MTILTQNHIKYGLMMSGFVVLCLVIMEATGQNQSFDAKYPAFSLFMMIAPFVIWFLGIKTRKEAQKNKLSFKEGVTEGFKISVVFAFSSALVFLSYYFFINPEIVKSVGQAYQMKDASFMTIVVTDMLTQIFSAIIFGTIYAAIISFFLKSKK